MWVFFFIFICFPIRFAIGQMHVLQNIFPISVSFLSVRFERSNLFWNCFGMIRNSIWWPNSFIMENKRRTGPMEKNGHQTKIDIWFYLDQLVYVCFFCYCILHCSITDTTSAAIDSIEHSARIVRHLWWMHTIHCNRFEIQLILHFQHLFWLAFIGMANMQNGVERRRQTQLKGGLIAIISAL